MMDSIFDIMKLRHSVRTYTSAPIEQEKRTILDALAKQCNEEGGLNIQIIYDEPTCFGNGQMTYGRIKGPNNYIALVGKEGDKLDEKAGYMGEKLVLKAQELGLSTCWAVLTHGDSLAKVGEDEREVSLIALGYGENCGVPHPNKPIEDLCDTQFLDLDWFKKGMDAVLLAPSARNKQPLFFTVKDGEPVISIKEPNEYARIDVGIAAFHFEAVTGRKIKL